MPDFWLSGSRSVEPSIRPGDKTPSIYLRTSTDDGWLFVGDLQAAAKLAGAANAVLSHYQRAAMTDGSSALAEILEAQ